MKVVLVHNRYGSAAPSGENVAVDADLNLLHGAGIDVHVYSRTNDDLVGIAGYLKSAFSAVWNPVACADLRRFLRAVRPDVVHVHNTFPLLSPAVLRIALESGSAVVQTMHNYRTLCPAGTLSRNGSPCFECADSASVLPALKHGCYRDSHLATVPAALSVALHRRLNTWRENVDATICLTNYQSKLLTSCGVIANRIYLRPNHANEGVTACDRREPGNYYLFVGRLDKYKGIQHLLDAWQRLTQPPPKLKIIGDGPLRSSLERVVRDKALNVEIVGQVSNSTVMSEMSKARALVVPSVCPEGLPMVVREALAHGVPVIASRLGGLPEVVQDGRTGWLVEPGDPNELARIIDESNSDDAKLHAIGQRALAYHRAHFGGDTILRQLLFVYREAIAARDQRLASLPH